MIAADDHDLAVRFREEASPGAWFARAFARYWPGYQGWWLSEAIGRRPSFLEAEAALSSHMPEMVPVWQQAVEAVGGGDLEARFLSLWRPPPTVIGCAQAVRHGRVPLLVHNYDYTPRLFDGIVLRSAWCGYDVLATTDCLIGALDGMNDAGLCVSLNFGGDETVGEGFGAPMVVRYLLETCRDVESAARVLERVPTHMAYNVLVLDASGAHVTGFTRPGGGVRLDERSCSTNHQERVTWERHAAASATREREQALAVLLASDDLDEGAFVEAFLEPPLYVRDYDRGMGTLYTVAYRPATGRAEFLWPGVRVLQDLRAFRPGAYRIRLAARA